MTPPTDLHPEYGYLCPSPRLHRDARVAVISVLLGVIIGGIAVIALVADHDGHSYLSSLSSRAGTAGSGADTVPSATADSTDAVGDVTRRHTGEPGTSKPDNAVSDDTNHYVGADLAPKPRRVRVREAPVGSTIAAVPVGRRDDAPSPAAAAPSPAAPAAAAPAAPAATVPERSRGSASTSEAAADNATAAAPQKPAAAPKKPQKTARVQNQNRRRDDAADDGDARGERADVRTGRRFGDDDDQFSRRGPIRGGAPAAEGPPAPIIGLWSWSGSW